MNIFKTFYCRAYQKVLYLATFFLNFDEPQMIKGENSSFQVGKLLKIKGYRSALVVTDNSIFSLGLLNKLEEGLKGEGIKYDIYHDVVPNPTIRNVEEAYKIYKDKGYQVVIGFGGGSSLDTAKLVAVRATNPNKSVEQLKGLLKVRHKKAYLVAIPTTAGTGSEATVAAVIINSDTKDKYAVNDPKLIPNLAIEDPSLLVGLPSKVTSTTGMDALTHAIEAYIGKANTRKTKRYALEAIKLIYDNLYDSYLHPENLEKRSNMQKASYLAGVAFTRAYVGYVHAVAHALGGFYNVPHGLANAIILPKMLKAFGSSVYKKLASLYDLVDGSNQALTKKEKAELFIKSIEKMNKDMQIPSNFIGIYNKDDVDKIVRHALKEGNPLYPVPKEFSYKEMYRFVLSLVSE